ncbi:MAG: hypothetical protein RIC95_09705 [Vicingaceae bacterium]
MFKDNLPLKFLKFLLKNGGIKSEVDISSFLESNFPIEANNKERSKMRNFVELLHEDEYIKAKNINSLKITKTEGRLTDLKSKNLTAQLRPKGYRLIEDSKNRKANTLLTITSLILLFISVGLGIINSSKDKKIDTLDEQILKSQTMIDELQNQNQTLKKEMKNMEENKSKKNQTPTTKQNNSKSNNSEQ